MNILDKIDKHLNESDAAEQAKKLKLTSAGWGKWKNAQGEVTHKTENGKLVKIEKKEKKTAGNKQVSKMKNSQYTSGLTHDEWETVFDILSEVGTNYHNDGDLEAENELDVIMGKLSKLANREEGFVEE